jgi:hypothetical protein
VRSAPARRIDSDHHARHVIAGSIDGLGMLAFDIAVPASSGRIPEWAVTAAAVPDSVPTVRLTPARLWLHDPDGLAQLHSGDEAFDARWRVLGDARVQRGPTTPRSGRHCWPRTTATTSGLLPATSPLRDRTGTGPSSSSTTSTCLRSSTAVSLPSGADRAEPRP